jgi:hypothetical protein
MNRFFLMIMTLLPQLIVAQPKTIRAGSNIAIIKVSGDGRQTSSNWTISPHIKPDIYAVAVVKEKKVTFITDTDSASFILQPGGKINFVVLLNGTDSAFTRIEANNNPYGVNFSKSYQKKYNGKIAVEIPEVYELVHILIANTKAIGRDIAQDSIYFNAMKQWIEPYKEHIAIKTFDSVIQKNFNMLFNFKKDAYSFEFTARGQIVKSKTYHRIASNNGNTLQPYIPLLQSFSDAAGFRNFYKKHKAYYQQQIDYYTDSVELAKMQTWLNKNFPSTYYNCFKIIFSPLVRGNQVAAWFEDAGFKEAQAHVNFPYPFIWTRGFSGKAAQIKAGNIVFTELNHAYINPEADKQQYFGDIAHLCAKLETWKDGKINNSYNDSYQCFNEYMNWVLVSLRYADEAPVENLQQLLDDNINYMVKRRGFKKFGEFSHFLVPLYQNRKPDETAADLYPQIIQWFKDNQ